MPYDPWMAQGQFSSGIIPLPGTPAYQELLRRMQLAPTMNAGRDVSNLADRASQAAGIEKTMYGPGGAYASSSSSSSGGGGGTGAGLLDEILGLIRGTGMKEFGHSRRRLTEDYGTATQRKMSDLARRGLFRAGIGEQELLEEVDKPFSRGFSDLAMQQGDANLDLSLRKAAILGDIEAQSRKYQAEAMANAARTGTGSQTWNPTRNLTFSPQTQAASAGGGGIFGANFRFPRSGGGGSTSPPPGTPPPPGSPPPGTPPPYMGSQEGVTEFATNRGYTIQSPEDYLKIASYLGKYGSGLPPSSSYSSRI